MNKVLKIRSIIYLGILIILGCKDNVKPENTEAETAMERPNILLIMCDDLGYSDVGFNGAIDIPTPALDELANNGTICTSGYVAHPFCGPSRAGLMTGLYPHTFGSQFNLPANSETIGKGISLEKTFMSKILQDAGYYTGIVGKWHLGAVPQFHPNKRGFDDFYGFLGGGHKYFPEEYRVEYEKQQKAGQEVIWDYLKPLEHNGEEMRESEYLTDAFSREATRFVTDASKKENPFFLYLAYNAPHSPLEAKKEDLQKFTNIKDDKRRNYAAMVYAVDRGIGEIVRTLKATDQYENTLIVFLSDNGGKLSLGATNTPLTGGKGDTNEGGYRVPMFFHWPGKIASGKRLDYPISALDFYPTFTALAGASIPSEKQLDGKNIWADLTAGKNPRTGEMIYALRHREGYSDVGVRQDQWKALKTNQNAWKLYNLQEDLGEHNDLSATHPEQLNNMVKGAEKWSRSHTEPLWFDPQELQKDWEEQKMASFGQTFKTHR